MNRKYQICIILLADNGAEYSDEERAVLEESLEEIASLIETIENAEAAEGAILALPESVDPDDTEAEEQIAAAKGLYDALNEYEKGLVSDEAAEKLKTLLTQLTDYRIIEGDGSDIPHRLSFYGFRDRRSEGHIPSVSLVFITLFFAQRFI